jgi:hypothetical protein
MPALRITAPTHKGTLGEASARSIGTPVTIRTFHSSSGWRHLGGFVAHRHVDDGFDPGCRREIAETLAYEWDRRSDQDRTPFIETPILSRCWLAERTSPERLRLPSRRLAVARSA